MPRTVSATVQEKGQNQLAPLAARADDMLEDKISCLQIGFSVLREEHDASLSEPENRRIGEFGSLSIS